MAEDKKGGSGLYTKDHHKEVYVLLAALILIGLTLQRLGVYLQDVYAYGLSGAWQQFLMRANRVWDIWKPLAAIFSVIGVLWGVYSAKRLQAIEREEVKLYGAMSTEELLDSQNVVERQNDKWLHVLKLSNSDNQSDWRLAILEADVMLDELLRSLNYQGEGVGEMLKGVDPTDMLTLDAAWDAHKVRNRIAHDGSRFELNEREVKRVVSLFESVFKEFGTI